MARKKASQPAVASDIPAGYYGPRMEGQIPNLCHRHKRTITLGYSCEMGRLEAEGDLPPWGKVNPARRCFNEGGTN